MSRQRLVSIVPAPPGWRAAYSFPHDGAERTDLEALHLRDLVYWQPVVCFAHVETGVDEDTVQHVEPVVVAEGLYPEWEDMDRRIALLAPGERPGPWLRERAISRILAGHVGVGEHGS